MFKRMENFDGGEDEHRGRGGPIRITEAAKVTPFYDLVIQSAVNLGIPRNPDYNGGDQEGVAMAQGSIHKGRRQSTAVCYLEPARARPNLTIQSGAEASSLIMDGKHCVGIRYQVRGEAREARVGREVIVSCGTINSPKLLELSGIGQPEILRQHGIDVVHALPGVGENLRDHYAVLLSHTITEKDVSQSDISHGWKFIREGLRYASSVKDSSRSRWAPHACSFGRAKAGESGCHDGAHSLYSNPGKWRAPHLPPAGLSMFAHTQRTSLPAAFHIKSARPEEGARDQLQLPG